QQQPTSIKFLTDGELPAITKTDIVIDALFGTGLTRQLEGYPAQLVYHINRSNPTVVSIDIPSGLLADIHTPTENIIEAVHTLTFQTPKLAFMMTENGNYTGQVHVLDIGLHQDYYDATPTLFYTTGINETAALYKPRNQSAHKYNFGHALLYAGSKNMMGAAILCAKACLRSGAGLITVHTDPGTQPVMQTAFPEAITSTENDLHVLSKKKAAIGIGPGIESSTSNKELVARLCSEWSGPLVIDATALQLLAGNQPLLSQRTTHPTILTPHAGEFDALFGLSSNDFDRLTKAMTNAKDLNCFIVLKGPHTMIACPGGNVYFNTTGNAGMATAGSGDVLTGLLTGLLAQGYSEKDACILGVSLHGLAGNIAAEKRTQESMIASDIIESIGDGFKQIREFKN
ncbi:MAG: NAD(P)H-hydrate dehydratase, partial [Ferruginibacter sp.]